MTVPVFRRSQSYQSHCLICLTVVAAHQSTEQCETELHTKSVQLPATLQCTTVTLCTLCTVHNYNLYTVQDRRESTTIHCKVYKTVHCRCDKMPSCQSLPYLGPCQIYRFKKKIPYAVHCNEKSKQLPRGRNQTSNEEECWQLIVLIRILNSSELHNSVQCVPCNTVKIIPCNAIHCNAFSVMQFSISNAI